MPYLRVEGNAPTAEVEPSDVRRDPVPWGSQQRIRTKYYAMIDSRNYIPQRRIAEAIIIPVTTTTLASNRLFSLIIKKIVSEFQTIGDHLSDLIGWTNSQHHTFITQFPIPHSFLISGFPLICEQLLHTRFIVCAVFYNSMYFILILFSHTNTFYCNARIQMILSIIFPQVIGCAPCLWKQAKYRS